MTAVFLAATLLAVSADAANAAGPFAIDAVLSSSGSGALLGRREQAALGVLETVVNADGGIAGRPIRFAVHDDRSDPSIAAHLMRALIARHAAVVLGSTLAPLCAAMAVLARGGPVEYCFAPDFNGERGSYAFSAGVTSDAVATVLLRYAREGGAMRLGVITARDAGGLELERSFNGALAQPENRDVRVLARESFRPDASSVAAQMARIKAAHPEEIVAFATGAPLGTLLRAYHASGMTAPVTAPPANLVYAELARDAAFMPNWLYFAGTRGIVPDRGLGNTPAQAAQTAYFNGFTAAGLRPDYTTSLVWDPAMIVIAGLRTLGTTATAAQLHAYIEGLHLWAGINGLYDFRDGSQRGIGEDATEMYHWNIPTGELHVASRAAGFLR